MPDEVNEKDALRKTFIASRQAMPEAERIEKSKAIYRKVIATDPFHESSVIALYSPIRHEVDTECIFHEARRLEKTTAYPLVNKAHNTLRFFSVDEPDRLIPGTYGIKEPDIHRTPEIAVHELDMIIVPAVLLDEDGFRIGYGGGYYDRLLSDPSVRAYSTAIVYDFQVVERLPRHDHDVPVDCIVTENRMIAGTHAHPPCTRR
ncbi:MAG: 5-formyltetrahydrofolate cyclo-ligase [Deltaproteobacteria bacterium]|nr:5-formyltetrahydrofolate cyclo-ligase [Candidatus Zymogenaceae bacterium]